MGSVQFGQPNYYGTETVSRHRLGEAGVRRYESDEPTVFPLKTPQKEVTAENDGKFSFWQAFNNLGTGVTKSLIPSVKGLALMGAAMLFAPALAPVLGLIGTVGGMFQFGGGLYKATTRYWNGDKDGSEKAFLDIGEGITSAAAIGTFNKFALNNIKSRPELKDLNIKGISSHDDIKDWTELDELGGALRYAFESNHESAKLLTHAEGRAAILHDLKPSAIQDRWNLVKTNVSNLYSQWRGNRPEGSGAKSTHNTETQSSPPFTVYPQSDKTNIIEYHQSLDTQA